MVRSLPLQSCSWLTVDYLSGHLTSALGRVSLDEDKTTRLRPAHRDTHTDNVDEGFVRPTQPGETDSATYHPDAGSSTHNTPIGITPGQDSQEQFDQGMDDESLFSQFMNLDDWPTTQTTTPELDSPRTHSSNSSSVPPMHALEWDLEPTSLHLVDTKKFETFIDANGGEKVSPWPWGNFTYQPPAPVKYLEPEEKFMELRFKETMSMLREGLTEAMAEEAIRQGEKAAKLKERREKWEAEWGADHPPLVAFTDQVIRGRTIYNP